MYFHVAGSADGISGWLEPAMESQLLALELPSTGVVRDGPNYYIRSRPHGPDGGCDASGPRFQRP